MARPTTRAAAPVRMDIRAPVTQATVAGGTQVPWVRPKGVTPATAPGPIDLRMQLRLAYAASWPVMRCSGADAGWLRTSR